MDWQLVLAKELQLMVIIKKIRSIPLTVNALKETPLWIANHEDF